MKKIDKFDDKYPFSGWIYTIASRTVISYQRKQKWKNLQIRSYKQDLGEENQIPEDKNEHTWIWQIASSVLKEKEYLMLWLSYAEGRTHQEIAEHLDMQKSAIKVAIHRSRNKLHEYLTVHEGKQLESTKTVLPIMLCNYPKQANSIYENSSFRRSIISEQKLLCKSSSQ